MKNQNGITLLEVLISMFILAVGVLGLAPLIAISIYGNSYSDELGRANAFAQQEIELVTNMSDYGNLPYLSTTTTANGVFSVSSTVEDNTVNVTIPSGLYRINVVINWTDKELMPRAARYTTYKLKPSL